MQNTQNYKYIVVEDETLIRKNLIKKISMLQLPLSLVGEASNGIDAQILIEKHYPNLVITDIQMPQCNGIELSEYIHKNFPAITVIILSGYNDFSYAQSAIKFQVKDYLLKPINIEVLSESLQRILISIENRTEEINTFFANTNTLNQRKIYELLETYLQQHYQDDISFSNLAEKFGFTLEYLSKIFKKYSNNTPSKYLIKLRMNEAKRLLLTNPDLKIQNIAELVGYRDGLYFSRAFKTYTGIQPSEFRLQHKL